MEDKLDIIISKLNALEKDISIIKEDINSIKAQTAKMDGHIDFIEDVYEKVEEPLNYVTTKINRLKHSDPCFKAIRLIHR